MLDGAAKGRQRCDVLAEGRAELVRTLLDHSAFIDALDSDQRTALHFASRGDETDTLGLAPPPEVALDAFAVVVGVAFEVRI